MAVRRSFTRDESGITGWDAVQILILLILPIALFVFWYHYLRRIGRDEAAKAGPWTGQAPIAGAGAARSGDRDGKRTCARCGLTVRPSRSSGPPTCPNCMSVL